MTEPPRFPLVRIMLGNASLLSSLYLVTGVFVELVRRYHTTRWSERASLALEALPARVLDLAGLLSPLRRAYVYGHLTETEVRLAFGLAVIALIFGMALLVGAGMYGVKRWWEVRVGQP